MNKNTAYCDLKKSLSVFGNHKITMHKTPSSDSFEKLMMKITNKDAVKATNSVLKNMNEVHKLIEADHDRHDSLMSKNASRVFLTCFMIISFNDVVFSTKGVIEKRLIDEAKKTLESFEHFRDEQKKAHLDHDLVDEFIGNFHRFTQLFKAWKSQDAEKIVEVLCKAYYELEETMKVVLNKQYTVSSTNSNTNADASADAGASAGVSVDDVNIGTDSDSVTAIDGGVATDGSVDEQEDVKIWKIEIEEQKRKIIEQVRLIGGVKGMKRLDELKNSWSDSVDVLDEKSMLEIAKKAYWDRFAMELEGDKPDRSMLYKLLDEVRERLNAFTPNRKDLIGENNDAINIELLKNTIEHKAFNELDFMKLVSFIIDRLLMFETPAENNNTKAWRDGLMGSFAGKTTQYSVLLPELLRGVCERLDKIEHDYLRYINGCKKTSCNHCGATDFVAVINSYMGRPTIPRCPECNHLLIDLSGEEADSSAGGGAGGGAGDGKIGSGRCGGL